MTAQVRAELGGDLAERQKRCQLATLWSRPETRQQRASWPRSATHGANQHGGVSDTKSTEQPDATYILARLRRGQKGRFRPIPSPFLFPLICTGIGRNCPNRPDFASRLGFRGAVLGALLNPYPTKGAVS